MLDKRDIKAGDDEEWFICGLGAAIRRTFSASVIRAKSNEQLGEGGKGQKSTKGRKEKPVYDLERRQCDEILNRHVFRQNERHRHRINLFRLQLFEWTLRPQTYIFNPSTQPLESKVNINRHDGWVGWYACACEEGVQMDEWA